MSIVHKKLANDGWHHLTLLEQMANIGSEVYRAINWKNKGNLEYSNLAFYRALELIDLTIADTKNAGRLKEILRMREFLVDYFAGENIYLSDNKFWENYFYSFNYAARL